MRRRWLPIPRQQLGEPIDRDKPEGEWAVRVYYKPFVDWIWGGCLLMALGGLLAAADRRYRVRREAASPQSSAGGAPLRPVLNAAERQP